MSIFRFKQFSIQQKLSAAKVGTDAVLLGSWIKFNGNKILDIGSGTGVISLILAQRFPNSQINAIELDKNAFEEASYNFINSNWSNRLSIENISYQDFKSIEKFDLIISNPPFYKETTLSKSLQRDMARNVKFLPFDILINKSSTLLNSNGKLAVIIPYSAEVEFVEIALKNNLYLEEVCRVKGNSESVIKRSLLCFSKQEIIEPKETELVIEKHRHLYTQEYIDLTKYFYLKM